MQIQCLIRHVYDSTTNKFIAFRIKWTVKTHIKYINLVCLSVMSTIRRWMKFVYM